MQPLWWDLCVSLVPSGLGIGAVTGNCYNPFYAAILFPGRWCGWYPSAAPCGRAVTKGRATGRTNTLFIDFLQLPAIPAVRLSVLIFFFMQWLVLPFIVFPSKNKENPGCLSRPTGEITPCHFAHNIYSPVKEPSPPSEIPAPGILPNRKELA